jgi:molybdenum cofactor cytidylyltransferase
MQLKQAFRIPKTPCVAFVGSGGKTSALFQLARELHPPVIVTATTHLHVNQIRLADSHWSGEKPGDLAGLENALHGAVLVTGPMEGDRTKGLDDRTLLWLRAICDTRDLPLLIEADGSRQRPLKAPAVHEPPIPGFVGMVVVVAGLSALGKPLIDEFVHRPEIFARLSGLHPGETITPEALLRVLTHPAGGLKNIPAKTRRLALLNQADTPVLQAQAKRLAGDLLKEYQSVIIASVGQSRIHAVYEPVAGIILAAGGSSRFGQPKQLLDYHSQPFIRAVARTALAGGLSPVVVVTGANADTVEPAVRDLPVTITRNTDWENGQSSSIRAGLRALTPSPFPPGAEAGGEGAAIFLLSDQPQVPHTVIHALVEQHAMDLSPIVAPLVAGQRANPVLFDRVTFPDLMSLTGDVGGRAIFNKYPVTYLPWHEESLLTDVDTPEDMQRLRNREE